MVTPRASVPAPLIALLACAAALAAAGCGGGGAQQSAGERLGRPAADWSQLSDKDRLEAMRSCRLDAAIEAARVDGAQAAPYRSSGFAAVLRLPGATLRDDLDRYFADAAHRRQSLSDGCEAVIRAAVGAAPPITPAADFASPVGVRDGALSLVAPQGTMRVRARLSPRGARMTVGPAPGRPRTTARIHVAQSGDVAVVDLRGLPRGVSYLQVRVTAGGRSRGRLLVVHRRPGRATPVAPTFAPMVLRGQGSQGLPFLYVPRRAVATASTEGAPLAMTSGGTLLIAHGHDDASRAVALAAGRYRDVKIVAPGAWTIRIAPAR